jgi:hypothetical protein
MWRSYLTLILKEHGTGNFKNLLPKTEFIALLVDVENGLDLAIYTRKTGKNMASVVDVGQKCAVFVTANGMAPKNALRMRRQTGYLKLQNRLAGNDVIIVGQWLN